jgi:hypothetical protein
VDQGSIQQNIEDRPVQKRYYPITAITVILAIVAVIGYASPESQPDFPKRILFDNKGGKIVFSHSGHADEYMIPCSDCHHADENPEQEALPCGKCHQPSFGQSFVDTHVNWEMSDEYCMSCHHEGFDGQDSIPCSECHFDEKIADLVPPRMDAFHDQCMGCHEMMGGPYGQDQCNECHISAG